MDLTTGAVPVGFWGYLQSAEFQELQKGVLVAENWFPKSSYWTGEPLTCLTQDER